MARMLKVFLAAAILSGGALGGYAWLQGSEPEETGFTLVEVEIGDIIEKAVAVGQIEPRLKFHVKSKVSGIVRRAAVEVGQEVEAGDPLFEIVPDPTPTELVEAERRVQSAESAFKRAESDWKRASELARQGILPREDLDAAREVHELARIEVERTRDNLQLVREGRLDGRGTQMEAILRAPAAGILLERLVNPGDPVVPLTTYQAGTELATIADMSELIFKGTVDEIDVGKLQVGLEARLRIGALPAETVTGRLIRIAPQAIERDNAKLFEVEIELDSGQEVLLRAGYSANADLIIREKNDVLLVPERLLTFEEDGQRAYVELPGKAPGDEPRKVEVEIGLSDGLNVEVIDGLEKEDALVERPPRDILG
jgi:HlyD family secretion protein